MRDQSLHLHEHGARPLQPRQNGTSRNIALTLREEKRGRIGDFHQTFIGHFENADFIGRPETVFDGAQNSELMAAIPFEIQNRIDHMFKHTGTGDLAFLRHMPDKQNRDAAFFGDTDQFLRTGAHLRHRTGGGFDRIDIHGLNGIDHDQIHRVRFHRGNDIAHGGGRSQRDRSLVQPQPPCAKAHLIHRFFPRNIEAGFPREGELADNLQQKGRFTDARITADENRGTRDHAAARHTVEFRHARHMARDILVRFPLQADQLQTFTLAALP